MLELKVNKKDGDFFCTRFNGDLMDAGKYYFPMGEIESVDILDGGEWENEVVKYTPLRIWREDPDTVKEFDLFYNIRITYCHYWKSDAKTEVNSCGLCRV